MYGGHQNLMGFDKMGYYIHQLVLDDVLFGRLKKRKKIIIEAQLFAIQNSLDELVRFG